MIANNLALANYLTSSASRSAFDVDVRGLSVQQIIPEYITARQSTRPGLARQLSGLLYNLTKMEKAYNIILDPVRSHTARRTFATYNVQQGKSIFKIRRCTGHKTEESFNKYICLGTDE